jgi:hypothetical protein
MTVDMHMHKLPKTMSINMKLNYQRLMSNVFFSRALLDAKKQRLCPNSLSASTSSSTTTITPHVTFSLKDQVHSSTAVGDQSSSSSPTPLPSSSSLALEVNTTKNISSF